MFRNRKIESTASLLDTLKKMDAIDKKLLIVIDNKTFRGLVSAGDIQCAINNNESLHGSIKHSRESNHCPKNSIIENLT